MFYSGFKKACSHRLMTYFSWFFVLFVSQMPPSLWGEACVVVDDEDARRTRIAMIAGGATMIALVGGIAFLTCGSSKRHDRHSSHCCSSSCSSRSPYSYSESSYSYSSYSIFSHNEASSWSGSGSGYRNDDPQFFERGRNLPYQAKIAPGKSSKKNVRISGHFFTYPVLLASSKGSVTAYVRLPDGSVDNLGSLSFSSGAGSSLSFGPYKQEGTYFFGIRVDEGSIFTSQIKIASVEINFNDEAVKKHDFLVPAHSPSLYEPAPFEVGPFNN